MGCAATGWPLMVLMRYPVMIADRPLQAILAQFVRENARDLQRRCERSGSSAGRKRSRLGLPRRSHATSCVVAQNHLSVGGAGEHARSGLRIFFGNGQIGPAQT
jgi:hypothetical protein